MHLAAVQQNRRNLLACPDCHASLITLASGFACSSCTVCYPLIAKSIPALFPGASLLAVAKSFIWLKKQLAEHDVRIENFAKECWSPPHWDAARTELINGLRCNREFLSRLSSRLEQKTTSDLIFEGISSPAYSSDYNDFSFYLQRDWSNHDQSGRDSRRLVDQVAGRMRECGGNFDSAVAVGAGLGRATFEFTRHFEQVFALERSPIAALIFDMLQDGFVYWHENFSNADSINDQIYQLRHEMSAEVKESLHTGKLHYVVGDARKAPFSDGTIGTVISIYFTDVLGLDIIMPEARRLLREGGLFVHFGPLHYHFKERRRMYPVTALRQILCQGGFTILEDSFIPEVSREREGRMMATVYRNWFLVARKN